MTSFTGQYLGEAEPLLTWAYPAGREMAGRPARDTGTVNTIRKARRQKNAKKHKKYL